MFSRVWVDKGRQLMECKFALLVWNCFHKLSQCCYFFFFFLILESWIKIEVNMTEAQILEEAVTYFCCLCTASSTWFTTQLHIQELVRFVVEVAMGEMERTREGAGFFFLWFLRMFLYITKNYNYINNSWWRTCFSKGQEIK